MPVKAYSTLDERSSVLRGRESWQLRTPDLSKPPESQRSVLKAAPERNREFTTASRIRSVLPRRRVGLGGVRRGLGARAILLLPGMVWTQDGDQRHVARDADHVLRSVRAPWPVAQVFGQDFFLPVRTDYPSPDRHPRHRCSLHRIGAGWPGLQLSNSSALARLSGRTKPSQRRRRDARQPRPRALPHDGLFELVELHVGHGHEQQCQKQAE